jgi:hypothetical protein
MQVVEHGGEPLRGPELRRAERGARTAQRVGGAALEPGALERAPLRRADLLAHGEAGMEIRRIDPDEAGEVSVEMRGRARDPAAVLRRGAERAREQETTA